MAKLRRILHCDLNSFYASVELLSYPELADKPVAVCGNPENRHGIILAKNEAAKRYHIKTAETVWQARRKCPDLILLPPHHDQYRHYSKIINSIYNEFTDLVEPFSIDESWLDVTGSMHLFGGSGTAMGDLVRRTVKERTGLTISVGVSWNKIFAKLGSDYKKPDAVTVITPQNYKAILWPLPVEDLIFVGKRAAERLRAAGITTIGELAVQQEIVLQNMLGKNGTMLWRYANGFDDSPVRSAEDKPEAKSIGHGTTFGKDLTTMETVRKHIYPLCEAVSRRLKQKGLRCRGVQVVVRDASFRNISRQVTLSLPTNLTRVIFETAVQIVADAWDFPRPIRMLTVTAIGLEDAHLPLAQQLSIFNEDTFEKRKKQGQMESAVEALKARYGDKMVVSGVMLEKQLDEAHGENMEKKK